MKTQLDLTENFLRAQKQLYRSYCDSLEDAVTEQHRQRRRIGTDEPKVRPYAIELKGLTSFHRVVIANFPCYPTQ